MAEEKDTNELSQEEMKNIANLNAAKLAFLISILKISDEEKQSLVSLLPSMTLEQIEELMIALENAYAMSQTKDVDKELEDTFKEIKAERAAEQINLNQETAKKIKEMTAAIKK